MRAATVLGVQAFPALVEADLQSRLPTFSTAGLPDVEVRKSRNRGRAAIVSSGFAFPAGRVTVHLEDADLPEEESAFDLAIAVDSLQPKDWPAPIPGIGPAGDSFWSLRPRIWEVAWRVPFHPAQAGSP